MLGAELCCAQKVSIDTNRIALNLDLKCFMFFSLLLHLGLEVADGVSW